MRHSFLKTICMLRAAGPASLLLLTLFISLYSLRYVTDVFSWARFYTLHPDNCGMTDAVLFKLVVTTITCATISLIIAVERGFALARIARHRKLALHDLTMFIIGLLTAAVLFMLESATASGHMVDVIK